MFRAEFHESQPFLGSWQFFLLSVFTSHVPLHRPPHLPSRPINPSTRTSFQGTQHLNAHSPIYLLTLKVSSLRLNNFCLASTCHLAIACGFDFRPTGSLNVQVEMEFFFAAVGTLHCRLRPLAVPA